MKRIILYIDSKSLNDATSHYIEIVNRAATKLGFFFLITESINNIKFGDIIFTITTNNYIKGFFLRPFCKTIFWSQGIDPEESLLRDKNYFKFVAKSAIEFFALRHRGFKFFVSNKMLNHYRKKYNFNTSNFMVMPCYNLQYEQTSFSNLARYDNPSFVYAGSLSVWQNIDETLQVYKHIENELEKSTLTLLTNEYEKATDLITYYKIQSANVKYVELEHLNMELLKYKYGFLLRKNNLVNNVATPTKMNSYLACGLIPIYTNAICDYTKKINLNSFHLEVDSNLSVKEIAQEVIKFENTQKDYSKLEIEIKSIFESYYDDNKYIHHIKNKLKNYLS
jgi:hypothetical protein